MEIIKLSYKESGKESYYSSLAAIYENNTVGEIGAPIWKLWKHRLTVDNPFETDRCVLSKHRVHKKEKKK